VPLSTKQNDVTPKKNEILTLTIDRTSEISKD
jgi:hypothetical protein